MFSCDVVKLREPPKASINEMKTCNKCFETKCLTSFVRDKDIYRNLCKACKSQIECLRRKQNLEKFREKDKLYYESNKEQRLEKNKAYRAENREKVCLQKQQYYSSNKEKIKEYHQENKDKRNEYKRNRYLVDVQFRIKENLKARMSEVLKQKKSQKSSLLIGCSPSNLKEWLEYLFDGNMSWNNYGEYWHIDHLVPISFFDLSDELHQQLCFHWTNLRPLNAQENIAKSNKIVSKDIQKHIASLQKFQRYQTNFEKSWWQRVELWYGKNPEDESKLHDHLKWAIRSQAPKSNSDKDMEKVQRLNGNGSEEINQLL